MANQIIHDSNTVVDSSGFVSNAALRDSASPSIEGNYHANNTQVFGITVDAKGRVTNAISNTDVKITGVTFGEVNAAGAGTLQHAPNQKIYISSSAPNSDSIGNNGDIWYQTLT